MSTHRNAIVLLAGLLAVSTDAGARGGRGGGGGGFRGGGGGGARTSATRSTGSFSRPSGGGTASRPSGGGNYSRPSGGGNYSRPSGGGNYAARTSNTQTRNVNNTNINSNRNVNRNVNRDVNIDGDRGYYAGGRYYGGAPVARAAAVTAGVALTAAAIGSVAYSLPAGCSPYYGYYSCGGVYYQPQYEGDSVTYLVVPGPEGAEQPAAEGSAYESAQPIVQ
jgi:hypothetical protein